MSRAKKHFCKKVENTRTSKASKSENSLFSAFSAESGKWPTHDRISIFRNRPFLILNQGLWSRDQKFNKIFDFFPHDSAEKYKAPQIAIAICGHKIPLFKPFLPQKGPILTPGILSRSWSLSPSIADFWAKNALKNNPIFALRKMAHFCAIFAGKTPRIGTFCRNWPAPVKMRSKRTHLRVQINELFPGDPHFWGKNSAWLRKWVLR